MRKSYSTSPFSLKHSCSMRKCGLLDPFFLLISTPTTNPCRTSRGAVGADLGTPLARGGGLAGSFFLLKPALPTTRGSPRVDRSQCCKVRSFSRKTNRMDMKCSASSSMLTSFPLDFILLRCQRRRITQYWAPAFVCDKP